MASAGSRIGPSTVIRGSIRGAGNLELEGRVEGTIDVDGDVIVGGNARIKSPVSGGRVVVRGAVAGNVRGREAVVLEDGARVVGDLVAPQIGIRPGGLLRGHVSSGDAFSASSAATTPRAARLPAKPVAVTRAKEVPPPPPTPRKNEAPARTQRASTASTATSKLVQPVASPLTKPARSAPAPIMPTLQKGAKAALKKKAR